MKQPGSFNLALQQRAIDSVLKISRAEVIQHPDDSVAAEIRRIAHRWSPVAVTNAGVLVNQVWVFCNQVAHGFEIVAPDRVDQLATLDHARPARRTVSACERVLHSG